MKEFRTWLFRICILGYGLLIRLAWFPLFDGTLHDNSPSTPRPPPPEVGYNMCWRLWNGYACDVAGSEGYQ